MAGPGIALVLEDIFDEIADSFTSQASADEVADAVSEHPGLTPADRDLYSAAFRSKDGDFMDVDEAKELAANTGLPELGSGKKKKKKKGKKAGGGMGGLMSQFAEV